MKSNLWRLTLVLLAGAGVAAEATGTWTLTNPTGREYTNELVRLKINLPEDYDPAKWAVLEDGREVASQAEHMEDRRCLWIAANLSKGQKRSYILEPRAAKPWPRRVAVRREGDTYILENGLTGVRIPAAVKADEPVPPPVLAVLLPGGKWVGQAHWNTDRRLQSFEAKVVGDGTLFGKVRLEYRFEGVAGIDGVPAYYRVEITVPPDRRHVVLEESFEMSRLSYWELDVAHGWKPGGALTIPHFGHHGDPSVGPDGKPFAWPPSLLNVGQTRMGDTLLNLIPRWSQAFDDGWFFMTHDGENAVGTLACRAGKWVWPHDSVIEVKVKESADYAGLRCLTRHGKRYWYLLAGPKETWADVARCTEYVNRHTYESLDKLHQEYLLDWPGLQPPLGKDGNPVPTPEEYSCGAGRFGKRSRPFFGWGRIGGGVISGDDHPIVSLIRAQLYLDPDTFGNYWLFYSPENPNFATHWWGPAFEEAAKCKEHPRFRDLCKLLEMKLREDVYHSFTVPGGAGQECPGYMTVGSFNERAKFCREHFGFDASTWPQYRAAGSFLLHASHPMANGTRRSHPGGDTHPPGKEPFEVAKMYGISDNPATFTTEELPGFGVVFRKNPCTPRETYLAFKSGPSRGHYHGDQLSFHYCAYGRPLAVDHHCSYAPRAGQEHMHNRVAFHRDDLPYANMDGFERLIAFKTGEDAEVAMGQVESERLRKTDPFPSEGWDTLPPLVDGNRSRRYPGGLPVQLLKYRRTIVFLKSMEPDCFVIRDQYSGPEVYATWCLHVLGGKCEQAGKAFNFDGLNVQFVKPETFNVSRHDWEHEYGGKEVTKGLRATVKGSENEFIAVLMPRPIKRSDAMKLVFKDVFQEEVKAKGIPPEIQKVDLQVVVAWAAGKPACAQADVSERVERKQAIAYLGTINGGDDGTGPLRLSVEGVRGRFEKDRVKFEGAVVLERKGDSWSGTYTGTVWDVAAMKTIGKGLEAKGKACGGVAEVTVEKDVAPPVPLFDEEWRPPAVEACPGGVRIGGMEVLLAGGLDDHDGTAYVTVKRGSQTLMSVTGKDVNLDRSQGTIGLFVPDAGYPFGLIPDWLLRQRVRRPDWYVEMWPLTERTFDEKRGVSVPLTPCGAARTK
jgi:hypothetical protein